MILNPHNIILSINTSIIIILVLSIFFFQSNTHLYKNTTYHILGVTHNTNFEYLAKNSLFFTSILKYLAIISILPLLLNIIFNTPEITISFFNWITNNTTLIKIELRFDLPFNTFLTIALLVSWSILEFSYYYMNNDPNANNFFRLLIIFLLNMIILTSTNNLFLLFIGWEGVGFLSFLLISWWSSRSNANNSAIQAIIYNRIGDIGILLFFSLSITIFNSWSLSEILSYDNTTTFNNIILIGALIAATGKSAQFGLHPWLPAAMEGPTPVSALLHSSTMVVAGIFLLIRLNPMYQSSSNFNTWCLILGSITAIFAATTAISQHDIKKIIAYSTTSQLGLMMVAIGLGQPNIALFHICTHAFFKAMLFLSSGSIIHSLNDEQDIRKIGGLHLILPNTSTCIILGSLALSGIPFLSGFYSKDLILEIGLTNLSNFLGIILSLIATILTSVYSLRIILFCFINNPSFCPLVPTSEENNNLTSALNRLGIGTILSGWVLSNLITATPIITLSSVLKTLALLITILGIIFSLTIIQNLSTAISPHLSINTNSFATNQWFFENLSHILFLTYSFITALYLSTRNIDRGWSENIGPQGIAISLYNTTQQYQLSQTGYIKQYLLYSILTITTLLIPSLLI
uniref:NADH-ubiquinone oxidoreductase chain 5 n=1 Tax=Crossaster papposus TaxID=60567 RepID=A0A7M3UIZ4_CROPA|nr:NADH dehydrogenase subunit 5 [Crossaster papposus]QOH99559.1 NADH dehydrogenase subunit 5 [Crossaster papposus]